MTVAVVNEPDEESVGMLFESLLPNGEWLFLNSITVVCKGSKVLAISTAHGLLPVITGKFDYHNYQYQCVINHCKEYALNIDSIKVDLDLVLLLFLYIVKGWI